MRRAYLVRAGAYGDHIHMSNVIKALDDDGWDITFEYNIKGAQIHANNPRINTHNVFEPYDMKTADECKAWFLHLERMKKEHDLFVNFSGSLENSLIAPEKSPEYFWPLRQRREKNTKICYYDQSMKWAGLTDKKYMGRTGEVWFTREEHDHVREQLLPYRDKFVILWALRGTMYQKAVYPIAREVCDSFLESHQNAVIITTGDDFCKKWEWPSSVGTTIAPEKGLGDGNERLIHKSARMPFRQALHYARYANLVVTPETGLGIGAGAFGTPKIMLMTAASLQNIVGNDKNDFSIQSSAWCSPCTRAIYNTKCCPINPETNLPICVDFDKELILSRMDEVYNLHIAANWSDPGGEVYI